MRKLGKDSQDILIVLIMYAVCECFIISKLNAFLFLFSKKTLIIRAGAHKMLVRIANREDSDQTASSEAV